MVIPHIFWGEKLRGVTKKNHPSFPVVTSHADLRKDVRSRGRSVHRRAIND